MHEEKSNLRPTELGRDLFGLLEDGDCWKVKDKHMYPPEVNLRVYDDDWKWADNESAKYRWRDPGEGRGYYRGGVWVGF